MTYVYTIGSFSDALDKHPSGTTLLAMRNVADDMRVDAQENAMDASESGHHRYARQFGREAIAWRQTIVRIDAQLGMVRS